MSLLFFPPRGDTDDPVPDPEDQPSAYPRFDADRYGTVLYTRDLFAGARAFRHYKFGQEIQAAQAAKTRSERQWNKDPSARKVR